MADETVDLPANSELKELAHHVVADGNEYAVPMLIDFYKALAELDAEYPKGPSDFLVDDPQSDVPPEKWGDIIYELANDGPIGRQGSRRYIYEAAADDGEDN